MTALGGYWGFGSGDATASCARIVAALAMYGPDGSASGGPGSEVALGRCLSLNLPEDIHDRGIQVGGGGRYTLVADARIDNRAELAVAIGLDPARAARTCDAGIVLAAIERWGEQAIAKLIGDFALILWDAERRHLILARDFVGGRPLFYSRGQGFIAVASMPKGLHAVPDVPRAPRTQALIDFLSGSVDDGNASFFEGIAGVEPGCIVTLSREGSAAHRYWPGPTTPVRFARNADYAEALAAELDRATAVRLRRAGGGVGSHLSAGLDSSSVAATAARLLGDVPLTAYTAVPLPGTPAHPTRLADEGPIAAAVAALYRNIDHRLIRSGETSPLDGLDRAVHLFDMPVRDLTNLTWTAAIAEDAQRRGISVLLTGQMGNFTISHDGTPHLAALLGRGRIAALARAGRGLRREGMRWSGVAVAAAGPYLPRRIWRAVERAAGRTLAIGDYAALAPPRPGAPPIDAFDSRPWRDGAARRIANLRRNDLGAPYKGLLGGYGVDVRDPTADRRLVEFCLAIPEEQFILDGATRSLARRAFADRLPAALLNERRRGFQSADWPVALAAAGPEVAAQIERLALTPAAQFLDIDRLRAMSAALSHDAAAWPEDMMKYRIILLRALAAGHFARRTSGSNH